MKLKHPLSLILCGLTIVMAMPTQGWTQSSSTDSEAVIRFDFNLKRLRANPLVGGPMVEQMLQPMGDPSALGNVDLKTIDRIYGGAEAPANLQEAMSLDPQGPNNPELPLNFFVRIVFSDKAAAEAMMDQLKQDSDSIESNGKTYYKPKRGAPANLRGYMANDNTVEIGTVDYVTRSDRDVFTDGLLTNWNNLSKTDAVRISFDVVGMQELFDEGMAMARQQAPPEMMGVIEMGSNLAGLSFGMDMDSDNMLTMAFLGKDSEGAENIKDGLNGLLALAKMSAQQSMAMIQDEDQKAAAKQIMAALKANSKGNAVMVQIPKPNGLEEMIEGMMQGLTPGAGF